MKIQNAIGLVLLISVTGLATGCGTDTPSFSLQPAGQSFKQSSGIFNNQLDILWVVDNSGSMSPLQQNMVSNFSSFISSFQAKGYDFHMSVTTTDAYKANANLKGYNSGDAGLAKFADGTSQTSFTNVFVINPSTPNLNNTFVTNATQGSNGSGDERAFSSMSTALSSALNTGFLRPQSFVAVIILSDEDDFSSYSRGEDSWTLAGNNPNYVADHDYSYSKLDTVASYESYLDTLTQSTGATRRWSASAITVLDNTCLQSHIQASSSSIIGQRYIQLANDTSGALGSICDASYATALNQIQSQIATLSTQFFLQRTPQVNTIVVTVNNANVVQDANNGWTYSSAANSIQFHGSAIPAQNSSINVNFTPTTVLN